MPAVANQRKRVAVSRGLLPARTDAARQLCEMCNARKVKAKILVNKEPKFVCKHCLNDVTGRSARTKSMMNLQPLKLSPQRNVSPRHAETEQNLLLRTSPPRRSPTTTPSPRSPKNRVQFAPSDTTAARSSYDGAQRRSPRVTARDLGRHNTVAAIAVPPFGGVAQTTKKPATSERVADDDDNDHRCIAPVLPLCSLCSHSRHRRELAHCQSVVVSGARSCRTTM